jgi:hypothetical protein
MKTTDLFTVNSLNEAMNKLATELIANQRIVEQQFKQLKEQQSRALCQCLNANLIEHRTRSRTRRRALRHGVPARVECDQATHHAFHAVIIVHTRIEKLEQYSQLRARNFSLALVCVKTSREISTNVFFFHLPLIAIRLRAIRCHVLVPCRPLMSTVPPSAESAPSAKVHRFERLREEKKKIDQEIFYILFYFFFPYLL